jgi:hypothetical protein
MHPLKFQRLFVLAAFLASVSANLWAGTPTATRTSTPSPTATLTATPTVTMVGTPLVGSYGYLVSGPAGTPLTTPSLVQGSTGNSLIINYTAAANWNSGTITVVVPAGLGVPTQNNFFVSPAWDYAVESTSYYGQTVTVQISDLVPGNVVQLFYGFSSTGFACTSLNTSESLQLYAYPDSATLGLGAPVPTPAPILIYSPTPSVSPTVSPSPSASPTASDSPTPSVTRSFSATRTVTPFAGDPTSTFSASPTASPTLTATQTPTFSMTITPSVTGGSVTSTYTNSPTPTVTRTGTPGSGSYSYVSLNHHGQPGSLGITYSDPYNVLLINYVSKDFWTTGGEIMFTFPAGFDPPTPDNFLLMPAWDWALFGAGMQYGGQVATVQVMGLVPNQQITFEYGGLPSAGFNYTGHSLTETVQVAVNPYAFANPAPVDHGVLHTPGPIPIWSPVHTRTVTPTLTVTKVFSPTLTPTPDFSHTVTATFTLTPIGPDRGIFYSYPNPFDFRRTDVCTFRFPAAASADITIYNLLGQVVARVPQSSIYPQGFPGNTVYDCCGNPVKFTPAPPGGGASWSGRDDYGGKVAGGLYFAVLHTPGSTQTLKFTILH